MKKGILFGLAGFVIGIIVGGELAFSFYDDLANAVTKIGRTDDFTQDEIF